MGEKVPIHWKIKTYKFKKFSELQTWKIKQNKTNKTYKPDILKGNYWKLVTKMII